MSNRDYREYDGYGGHGTNSGYDNYGAYRNQQEPVRRRKKKKKRGGAVTAVLFILCVALLVVIGVLLVVRYKESKTPIYEHISMTDEAAAKAYVWLSQIESTDITYEEVKNCLGDINLELVKTPTKKKGTYTRKLADGSYDACANQAQTGFEKAYKLAVMNRLRNSGYEGDVNEELVEELMMEAYEVSVTDYLKGRDVSVFPTAQEISERFEGEVSDEVAE